MAYDRKAVRLKGRKRHPLLTALANRRIAFATVARGLNVTPQALACWVERCEEDKHFLVPAEQVPKLCGMLKVRPATLRPDLYKPQWVF